MVQLLINILLAFGNILLIGYSFRCIYITLRFFHLAHAISLAFGAYFVYTFSIYFDIPLLVSAILSILVGIIIMLSVYFILYKKGDQKQLVGWEMMVISLGLYVILQNAISIIWGDTRTSLRTWDISVGYNIWGGYITKTQITSFFICVFVVSYLKCIATKTNIGKKINAVATNPEMSMILGISSNTVKSFCIVIGTALMACAGILIATDVDMTPTMGFDWLLYGVVAMIIAGTGKTRYLVFASLLLATAQHLSAYFLDSKWMNATAYVILIIFLYFRPYGFSGRKIKKTEV